MPSHRRLPLTPMMLALALPWAVMPAGAAEAGGETPPPATTAPTETSLAAQAAYAEAYAYYRKAAFAEAKDKIDEAVRLDPANADAQRLREDILAVLSQRDNRVQMAATWSKTLQDVRTQETAVRVGALIAEGDAKMAAGNYAEAENDFDRAEVAMRSFPFPFPWGDLPAQVAGKRLAARAQARTQENERAAQARSEASERARAQAELQQQALANKVDELLRRAKDAYDRKDFKRAEVDAWNAYELDRRREDARSLYLAARREGHELFDEKHEDERLERVARVSEEIHKSLIPQSELLVYPEDWKRRAQRKPREIGAGKEEPWMATMKDSLEQRVTFDFQDAPFEDTIGFLRQVTGVNIVVAPTVIAANGGGTVTLKVKDMRFGDALKWILELTSLKMALQDQAIYISNEAITGSVVLRMYDVTDLIQQARDMPGREMAYSSGGSGGAGGINIFQKEDTSNVKPPDPEELVEFIKKNVAPDNWDEATGHGIEQRAGSTLFISHVPEVHAQIEQLLSSLRNQQSLQVNMDVRLLDVRKNFFEEIGVDWLNKQGGDPSASNSLIQANSSAGYTRQNNNSTFLGSNTNNLPASQNTATWSSTGLQQRGLQLELSHNPFNFIGTDQINAVLVAAETEGDSQTLEHPSLTCFNGQRASASFMNQYAYISDYEVVSSNLDPKITVLTFGNIIDMRPVVSSDRKYITLEVRPSSVQLQGVFTEFLEAPRIFNATGTGGGETVITPAVSYPLEMPNVLVKTLRSTILLPDKASLLIGGFQRSLRENTHAGIPFLSHIPFLGRLFSRNGTYDEDRRLFYLLHAEILDLSEKEALQ